MLYLASASPRRRELLQMLGMHITVCPADIDEHMDPTRDPAEEVARVSALKAAAAVAPEDAIVIAADTIVVCQGRVLGKPQDEAQAQEMLELLSGRDHQVMTGCTVLRGALAETFTEVTDLHFRELSESEIHRYIASGEPMDKAGSYGIQGGAALFCQRLEGDYYNVMGLPVCHLGEVLRHIAPELFA